MSVGLTLTEEGAISSVELDQRAGFEGEKLKLLALTCSNCGAPVSIPSGVEFFTCSHCHSKLSLQKSGGAYITAVLQEIDGRTDRLENEVRLLRLRDELHEHERRWERERPRHMIRDGQGRMIVPRPLGARVLVVYVLLVGIVGVVTLSQGLGLIWAAVGGLLACVATFLFSLGRTPRRSAIKRIPEVSCEEIQNREGDSGFGAAQ